MCKCGFRVKLARSDIVADKRHITLFRIDIGNGGETLRLFCSISDGKSIQRENRSITLEDNPIIYRL